MADRITEEQVLRWVSGTFAPIETLATWFAEVMNGDYTPAQAREDCLSVQSGPPATSPAAPREGDAP